jgi:hypothetical protein
MALLSIPMSVFGSLLGFIALNTGLGALLKLGASHQSIMIAAPLLC